MTEGEQKRVVGEKQQYYHSRTRLLTVSSLFACIISISSIINIPIPGPVPITLQVFAVFLTTMVLGPKAGTLACSIYLLFGALGLPVYAGMTSGLTILLGPTGGYLLGFVAGSFVGGLACRKRASSKRNDLVRLCLSAIATLIVIYLIGALWLSLYLGLSLNYALLVGVAPFVPIDALKAVFAVPIALQLRWSRLSIPIAF
ncbi:MAG: biotin transporter BioY [Thaumarchaeota archaeon]|nr:biotin transporter BioY [Nitrososphaerota archaeon]